MMLSMFAFPVAGVLAGAAWVFRREIRQADAPGRPRRRG